MLARRRGGDGKNNSLSMPYVSVENANFATRTRRRGDTHPTPRGIVKSTRDHVVGFDLYASHGSAVRSMIYTCCDAGKWRSRGNCGEERFSPGGTRSGGADRLIN